MTKLRIAAMALALSLSLAACAGEEKTALVFPETGEPWCVVDVVIKGGQGEKLGLKPLDIILTINGNEIHDRTTLTNRLAEFKDSVVQLDVYREGQKATLRGRLEGDSLGVYPNFAGKDKFLTAEEARSDLGAFFPSLIDIHPNAYANFPEGEFSAAKEKVYGQIRNNLPAIEFWKLLAAFVARMGDGHTSVQLPGGDWNMRLYAGEKIVFPLLPFITDDGVFVRENLSSAPIPKGDLILAINGIPIEEILDEYERYSSGELRHFRLRMIEGRFHQMLFYLHKLRGPFKIKVKNAQGKIQEFRVNGVDKETYDAGLARLRDSDLHFESVPDLRTGIIRFNNFTDSGRFNEFLAKSFSAMKENNYEHLIIDLQNNGGGNSLLAETLIEYITDKPYRFFGGAQIKIHKGVVQLFPQGKVGDLLKYEDSSLKTPKQNELRFKGKVYVLVSFPTFSTASGFAAVIKDFGLGTLIGEETGGLPTCFGDVFNVLLPHSRLSVGISWKYFIRPSGNSEYILQGVMPDILVSTTNHDLLMGKNPALEKVKSLIRQEMKAGKASSPEDQFSFAADERLFAIYAFINAAGYDRELREEGMHPIRSEIRNELQSRLKAPLKEKVELVYRAHGNRFRNYGAFALLLSPPPEFVVNSNSPDYSDILKSFFGLDELLREFYENLYIADLFDRYAPRMQAMNDEFKPFATKALNDIVGYCRVEDDYFSRALKKIHFNVCPLMSYFTAWTAKVDSHLYIVSGPMSGQPGPAAFYHEALHHVINPITAKHAAEVRQKNTLLALAQEQLKGNYPEWESVVNDSFVRTIDIILSARFYGRGEDQIKKRIEHEYSLGFILCPYLYENLLKYEASQHSLEEYYPNLVAGIDVDYEKDRWRNFWRK